MGQSCSVRKDIYISHECLKQLLKQNSKGFTSLSTICIDQIQTITKYIVKGKSATLKEKNICRLQRNIKTWIKIVTIKRTISQPCRYIAAQQIQIIAKM